MNAALGHRLACRIAQTDRTNRTRIGIRKAGRSQRASLAKEAADSNRPKHANHEAPAMDIALHEVLLENAPIVHVATLSVALHRRGVVQNRRAERRLGPQMRGETVGDGDATTAQ